MASIFNALFRSASVNQGPAPTAVFEGQGASQGRADIATSAAIDASFSSNSFTPGAHDHSFDITTSSISEPTDILLPRGVPFVLKRRPLEPIDATSTPIKSLAIQVPLSGTRSRPIIIRDPSEVEVHPDPAKPKELTEWRKEQIRKQNPPKLKEPVEPKPIPALHGAPTLPYARNPSGVDSLLTEENSLGNGFAQKEAGPHVGAWQAPAPPRHAPTAYKEHTAVTTLPYQPIRIARDLIQAIPVQFDHFSPVLPAESEQQATQASLLLPDKNATRARPKISPSDILRSQLSVQAREKPLNSDTLGHSRQVVTYHDLVSVDRKCSASITHRAAQQIIEDADTYPTAARFIGEGDSTNASWKAGTDVPTVTAKSATAKDGTGKLSGDGKADASANWRVKTPAKPKASSGRDRQAMDMKMTSIADHAGNAPVMTIDSLFDKFAPSSGLSPVTIKVNTPPHGDPAIAEVSGSPLASKHKHLHRLASPEASLLTTGVDSESANEMDLISLNSEPDENSIPARHTRKAAKAKGTPGAGKLLQRRPPAKVAAKENTPPVPKAKNPLGAARTVASTTRPKATRQ